jgi:CheY-like chemotaxis protein
MLNLCVNARDAMPQGGQLWLAADNTHLDAAFVGMNPDASEGPYVRLSVRDSGSGIDPGVLDQIFDPFFTTKPVGEGSGLGLSTVLGIVRSHGGFIRVFNPSDAGTCFEVYLPASPEVSYQTAMVARTKPHRGQGQLILIVDDESVIRDATKAALEQNNYQTLAAHDGAEALRCVTQSKEPVRLVITDLMMPVMDGIALAKALRSLKPDLPILAWSGIGSTRSLSERKEELKRLGVTQFLLKPFSAATLLQAIGSALNAPPPAGAMPSEAQAAPAA